MDDYEAPKTLRTTFPNQWLSNWKECQNLPEARVEPGFSGSVGKGRAPELFKNEVVWKPMIPQPYENNVTGRGATGDMKGRQEFTRLKV